jgi:ubiquitin
VEVGVHCQAAPRLPSTGGKIVVKALTKNFTLDVSPSDLISSVKAKIAAQEGIPPEQQRLTVVGR